MANIGTGKIPTLLELPAQDVTPTNVQAQPAKGFDMGALWAGLFNAKNNGRTYQQTVMPIVAEVKPTESVKDDASFTDAPKP